MVDEKIVCIACGETFEWSANEQEFYKEKGFVQPKRCKKCRGQKDRITSCCPGMSDLLRRKMVRVAGLEARLVVHWGRQESVPFHFCPFCGDEVTVEKNGKS